MYVQAKSQGSKTLGNVTFAFTSRGDVAGGAPRFSLPINDGAFDPNTDYAFIDAAGCGAVNGDNPTNTATLVGTQNPSCHVNFHGTDYANWATFASANPTYKMASGYVPFIIADGNSDDRQHSGGRYGGPHSRLETGVCSCSSQSRGPVDEAREPPADRGARARGGRS